MTAKNYDPACYDLASRFLSDWPDKNTEANRDQLAALIQRTIEDDIEFGMPAVCAKCGTETKGEVAWIQGAEWCHPCADQADLPDPVGTPT